MTTSTSDATAAPDPENVLVMELKDGVVRIEMLPDLAPQHVEQIKKLTRDGFYDGIVFHRVIDGFMAQTGDPTGTGRGGSELPDIPAEFSAEPFERGVAGMARSQSPDSANSQFFITFAPARFLDKQYTVWGRVVEGMEYIDMIKKAPRGDQSGTVRDPDKIITLRIAADVD
ncbi:peptidylprolyl isomerase [Pelagibius litoralis]|nr:peptidylprolyl isomerase [Pelagibius litoralis]